MQIQLKVFSSVSALQENNKLFERIVEVHDDVSVPYDSLFRDMKFLFGSSAVITFNIQ